MSHFDCLSIADLRKGRKFTLREWVTRPLWLCTLPSHFEHATPILQPSPHAERWGQVVLINAALWMWAAREWDGGIQRRREGRRDMCVCVCVLLFMPSCGCACATQVPARFTICSFQDTGSQCETTNNSLSSLLFILNLPACLWGKSDSEATEMKETGERWSKWVNMV